MVTFWGAPEKTGVWYQPPTKPPMKMLVWYTCCYIACAYGAYHYVPIWKAKREKFIKEEYLRRRGLLKSRPPFPMSQ